MDDSYLNFSQIAGFYSQLAGVLAGFAFAALIIIATMRLPAEQQQQVASAYRPLMCSFFGLVATSLNYAVMVGEPRRSGRSAAVGAAAGVSFVAAGAVLAFAILVTLDSLEATRPERNLNAEKAIRLVRRILILVLPPMLVVLFLPALRDHETIKYPHEHVFRALDLASIIAVGTTAIISAALFVSYKRLSRQQSSTDLLSVPAVLVSIAALIFDWLVDVLSRCGQAGGPAVASGGRGFHKFRNPPGHGEYVYRLGEGDIPSTAHALIDLWLLPLRDPTAASVAVRTNAAPKLLRTTSRHGARPRSASTPPCSLTGSPPTRKPAPPWLSISFADSSPTDRSPSS
jgi:hypothetical protein